jgi:hypothetical protein
VAVRLLFKTKLRMAGGASFFVVGAASSVVALFCKSWTKFHQQVDNQAVIQKAI